jgi:hypothetical protein
MSDVVTAFVARYGPSSLVYSNIFIFPKLEAAADALNAGASLGDFKVARMLLCLFLAYPLGLLTPYLPSAHLRHLWCLIMGVLSVQCVFGAGWLHLMLPATAVYVATAFFRATGLLRGQGHWVAAVISFAYLIYRHLSRDAAFANGMDDSTLSMVMVVKLYTLCYNLYDAEWVRARRAGEKLDEGLSPKIAESREQRMVEALPNPLAYYAYVFNFCTVFTGPAFEFKEYATAQEQTNAEHSANLPSRFLPGLWKLVQGLVWFALAVLLQNRYATDDLFMLSHTEPSTPLYLRAVLLSLLFSRYKYYAIWKVSEGAAVLAGFGFRAAKSKDRKLNPAVEDFEAFTGFSLRDFFKGPVDSLGLGIDSTCDWEGASNVRFAVICSPPPPPPFFPMPPPAQLYHRTALHSSLLLSLLSHAPTHLFPHPHPQCNPLTVESRVSIRETIANWNTHVQSWLANYIALRLPKSMSRPLTFLASAFWHG